MFAILGINESVIINTPLPGKVFYTTFLFSMPVSYVRLVDSMTDWLFTSIDEHC